MLLLLIPVLNEFMNHIKLRYDNYQRQEDKCKVISLYYKMKRLRTLLIDTND